MASPILYGRFPERLATRVLEAASSEGVTVSKWLRQAALERLGAVSSAETERMALLAEARRFVAANRGGDGVSVVERLAGFLELVDGRISRAEQHGRQRALAEIADGALEPVDGEVIALANFGTTEVPAILETPVPVRKRGWLRVALAEERARALLQAPPEASPVPSAAGLLGEARTRELWTEAIGWPGWRRVFCSVHGIVPCAPGSDGARCYLGCTIPSRPEAA